MLQDIVYFPSTILHSGNLKCLLDVAYPGLCRKKCKLSVTKSCLPLVSDNLMQLSSRRLGLYPFSFSTFLK